MPTISTQKYSPSALRSWFGIGLVGARGVEGRSEIKLISITFSGMGSSTLWISRRNGGHPPSNSHFTLVKLPLVSGSSLTWVSHKEIREGGKGFCQKKTTIIIVHLTLPGSFAAAFLPATYNNFSPLHYKVRWLTLSLSATDIMETGLGDLKAETVVFWDVLEVVLGPNQLHYQNQMAFMTNLSSKQCRCHPVLSDHTVVVQC